MLHVSISFYFRFNIIKIYKHLYNIKAYKYFLDVLSWYSFILFIFYYLRYGIVFAIFPPSIKPPSFKCFGDLRLELHHKILTDINSNLFNLDFWCSFYDPRKSQKFYGLCNVCLKHYHAYIVIWHTPEICLNNYVLVL